MHSNSAKPKGGSIRTEKFALGASTQRGGVLQRALCHWDIITEGKVLWWIARRGIQWQNWIACHHLLAHKSSYKMHERLQAIKWYTACLQTTCLAEISCLEEKREGFSFKKIIKKFMISSGYSSTTTSFNSCFSEPSKVSWIKPSVSAGGRGKGKLSLSQLEIFLLLILEKPQPD